MNTPRPLLPPLSWLYVPGDRPERFAKALASGASVVIIDLEDAVHPSRKDDARREVLALLASLTSSTPPLPSSPSSPPVHVRVNDTATARGREDLAALTDPAYLPGLAGVRLPKIESTDQLQAAADLTSGSIPLHALVESAAGLVAVEQIAAHPACAALALGEQDLTAQLGLTAPHAVDALRLRAVIATAAAGLPPVPMSVFPDVRDEAGFLTTTRAGRALGMVGRSCIHPRQVPLVLEAFRPDDIEVQRAREVVAAADHAAAQGRGAVALPDGRFVDQPVLARARSVLQLADATAQPGAQALTHI